MPRHPEIFWSGRVDLNHRPLGPEPKGDSIQEAVGQALTTGDAPACTTACTSKPENAHEGKPKGAGEAAVPSAAFEALAALIRQLSAEERSRLAEMLTGKGETGTVDVR